MKCFFYEQNFKSEFKKSTGKPDDGPSSLKTAHISSSNNPDTKALTCEIEYDNDESLDIKEELIQDHDTVAEQKLYKTYEWCTTRGGYILVSSTLAPTNDSYQAKYSCDECDRSYIFFNSLSRHKRLEHAAVKPQFFCEFCEFKTNQKTILLKHINARHMGNRPQKTNLQSPKMRHYCDKCPRSYTWIRSLNAHKQLIHSEVKLEFCCDFCGHKTIRKSNLLKHITGRHMK
ncbi:zinc finger protein 254-like [Belonocnema kinseyi]|uniref:zinc finger protein 254-like n=1 Tax=Belonocnema kinseyi TaxID=2817044 RepID=UPI00143CD090|nr:zinc finger protein 254-like [Belonocnema kinseyi]